MLSPTSSPAQRLMIKHPYPDCTWRYMPPSVPIVPTGTMCSYPAPIIIYTRRFMAIRPTTTSPTSHIRAQRRPKIVCAFSCRLLSRMLNKNVRVTLGNPTSVDRECHQVLGLVERPFARQMAVVFLDSYDANEPLEVVDDDVAGYLILIADHARVPQ